MSPRKKRRKLTPDTYTNKNKRENESEESLNKRIKAVKLVDEDLQTKKRKNFITACEQVSCKAYFDHRSRLLLVYLPSCMKTSVCKHRDKNITNIDQMPLYAEESFMIEMKTNMWHEALEVCQMCISPTQYLSANVLREIVEIMLNAHDDECSTYTVNQIIDKCQQILSQNFSTHPPCLVKSLRKCYITFLTSPMNNKDKTFTNRNEFECSKGIIKYCMNRLEYEISSESKDGPLVDKYENIPEEMQESVQGMHWQKEKFEIFEVLKRSERIERLMAVLESIIELLQFDLGIWHSRYTDNFGCQIMRSHRPLMAHVLWTNNVLYTGAVNMNCRQILRLFVHMVHLEYPVHHLKIITTWLNTIVQTFYVCETNSNNDYPNTGKYCTIFANKFYEIISEMPQDSIIRIIEKIEPTFMQHLIALAHIKHLLTTKEDCILKIMGDFVKKSQWKSFPSSDCYINLSKPLFPRPSNMKRKLSNVLKKCLIQPLTMDDNQFPKLVSDAKPAHSDPYVNINQVVHTMYITLDAFLDTYNVQSTQETWDNLNEQLLQASETQNESNLPQQRCYTVTEGFIKKYKYIYQAIKELVLVLHEIKSKEELPNVFQIFNNIGLLEL